MMENATCLKDSPIETLPFFGDVHGAHKELIPRLIVGAIIANIYKHLENNQG